MRVHHLKKFFPILLFAGVLQSAFADLLPYSSARVDIFMKGSNIHNIQKEFAVLSLDGSIRAIGRVSTGRGGATGARRWQIIGVEYYKTSNKFNDAPDCLPYDKTYEEAKIVKLDDRTYQVYVVAQMWSFQPSEIIVPTGSEVDFYLTSKDVVHGFNIHNKNVNLMAIYGAINKTTVKGFSVVPK